jgi:hypothetical protein
MHADCCSYPNITEQSQAKTFGLTLYVSSDLDRIYTNNSHAFKVKRLWLCV